MELGANEQTDDDDGKRSAPPHVACVHDTRNTRTADYVQLWTFCD